MSPSVLTEDTLKALEELEARATPVKWYSYHTSRDDVALTVVLRNNAPELLRLARIGLETEKDRKP